MEEKQLYPNFIQAVWLMCMIFFVALIFTAASGYLQISEETVAYTLIKKTFSILIYYFPIYFAMKKSNASCKQITGNMQDMKYYIIPALFIMAGAKLVLLPLEILLKYFLYGITEIYMENTANDLIAMPFNILLFPALEELLFRGIILRSFMKRYSIFKAILLSSVLFGAMHISLTGIINAVLVSVIISCLYIKTKSIWICIIAHSTANILSIGYLDYLLMHYLHFTLGTYVITGTIIASAGVYLLNKACSKHKIDEASSAS